jgi:Rrf2 family protein
VLSQKTRYALKALLELAAQPDGVSLSSATISGRRGIPAKFLEAILVELKRDGVVRGQRGRAGGYQLARVPADISFGEVIRLMQGPLGLLPCVSVTQYRRCSDCADDRVCELQRLFREVRDSTASILDGWTLANASAKTNLIDAVLRFPPVAQPARRVAAKKAPIRRAPKSG